MFKLQCQNVALTPHVHNNMVKESDLVAHNGLRHHSRRKTFTQHAVVGPKTATVQEPPQPCSVVVCLSLDYTECDKTDDFFLHAQHTTT
jgi:hypothetical protein